MTPHLSEMKWGFSILSLLQHLKTFQKVQLRKGLLMQSSDADWLYKGVISSCPRTSSLEPCGIQLLFGVHSEVLSFTLIPNLLSQLFMQKCDFSCHRSLEKYDLSISTNQKSCISWDQSSPVMPWWFTVPVRGAASDTDSNLFPVSFVSQGWCLDYYSLNRRLENIQAFLVPYLNMVSKVLLKAVTDLGLNQQAQFFICFPREM